MLNPSLNIWTFFFYFGSGFDNSKVKGSEFDIGKVKEDESKILIKWNWVGNKKWNRGKCVK